MAKKKPKFLTEEERMEAARLWWRENGKFVVIGAVLGIGVVLGWRGWEEYQVRHARAAATLYYQLYDDLASQFVEKETEELDELIDDLSGMDDNANMATTETEMIPDTAGMPDASTGTTASAGSDDQMPGESGLASGVRRLDINYDPGVFETLKERYNDTVYPAMAYLEVARVDVENGDLEKAIDKLTWVAKTTTHQALKHIADIRRARVLIALERFDEALRVLDANEFPEEIEYLVQEVRGDALTKQGNAEGAAEAYRKALNLSQRPTDFLRMKLDELGLDSE